MFETLMRNSTKGRSSPRNSPTKKVTPVVRQLVELEKEIVFKRPNNVTLFIRDWASSRLNKLTLSNGQYNLSDEEDQQFQFSLKKGFQTRRRNALIVCNFSQKQVKVQKLEETKSVILIKLKSMQILKGLTNQTLWSLVQDFQENQYQNQDCIIERNTPVLNFYIIISGSVIVLGLNKKQVRQLSDGDQFGFDSLLFSNPSPNQLISHGLTRIAHVQGRRISKYIRQSNKQKYQIIWKALENIQFFKTLHNDELDKVAQIGMNMPLIPTQPQQQIAIHSYTNSFFIVFKGLFYSYIRRLTETLSKQHNRQFRPGHAFGIQSLKKQKGDAIVSQDYGAIIQIKCTDIERIIGPLTKLQKRKRRKN